MMLEKGGRSRTARDSLIYMETYSSSISNGYEVANHNEYK